MYRMRVKYVIYTTNEFAKIVGKCHVQFTATFLNVSKDTKVL